jgi:hypothetical protein
VKLVVPELGPALGRLIVPRQLAEPWVPLDDVREELATRVMEAAGAARHDAADDAPARALTQLDRAPWSAAWEEAVRRAAERVVAALDGEIVLAARRVRMPRRRRAALMLSAAERRALAARLASGGDGLEQALDVVGRRTAALRLEWPGDADTHRAWQDAQLLAARRLEAAWLALEAQVERERTRWAPELEALLAWRPALWPVFAIWAPLAALAIWLGLVVGGYLPAPPWLAERLGF